MKFVHRVIKLKNEDFIVLYPTIIEHILQWIQIPDLYQQVISILQTIVINVRIYSSCMDQNLQNDIHKQLEESLNVSKTLSIYVYDFRRCQG